MRVQIEHAFDILKARWRSLRSLPVRIHADIEHCGDHKHVGRWIRAFLVLNNLIHDWKNAEDGWLDGVQVDHDDDDLLVNWQLHGNETNRAVGGLIRDALRLKNARMIVYNVLLLFQSNVQAGRISTSFASIKYLNIGGTTN